MVCERWCVTKMCVKDGVWKMVVDKGWKMEDKEVEEAEEEKERRDTESKTRTPHKDVGNKTH